jgi:hypothetical protein
MITILDEWTERSRFVTLELELQHELYLALPQLLSVFPSSRAKKIIEETTPILFNSKNLSQNQNESNHLVVKSLSSCLSESAIPPTIISYIHTLLLGLYDQLPAPIGITNSVNPYLLDSTAVSLLNEITDAMKLLPKDMVYDKVSFQQLISAYITVVKTDRHLQRHKSNLCRLPSNSS